MAKPLAKLHSMLMPKWRWAQFSLATLFAVMATFFMTLGALSRKATVRQQAVASIKALGGDVWYDGEHLEFTTDSFNSPAKRFLRLYLPRDFVDDVILVRLPVSADDTSMALLAPLDRIQMVNVTGTQITDAGLVHLRRLKQLQHLWLDETRVTDAGLAHLISLKELLDITLYGTQITDEGVAEMRTAHPHCVISR